MDYKDYYKILGVDRKATDKEIKQAYRKLARKHHPDVNPDNKEAEARFKEINEAYEVLGNEANRKKYDELGENWKYYEQWKRSGGESRGEQFDWSQFGFAQPGARRGGAQYRTMTEEDLKDLFGDMGPFSSFFHTFFGGEPGTAGGRRYRTTARPRRGQDLEQPIEISLEEAYHGTTRILQMQDNEGRSRRIEAKIPSGVQDGSRVRLAGQGGPGVSGGPAGDVYLAIRVASHPRFERKGADLSVRLNVPLFTAILGGEVEVPHLNGRVMLKIPPETQNGKVFRLKGKGMPKLENRHQHGDLLAEIRVVLPEHLSEQERRLFEELAKLRGSGK